MSELASDGGLGDPGRRWSAAVPVGRHAGLDTGTERARPPAASLIAVGASAGGVESLQRFVRGLPRELPAAVAVVLHLSPHGPSLLAEILERATAMSVAEAVDGAPVTEGHIYVACPDRHLLVTDRQIRLDVGEREHAARPAIDVLFRSAVESFGPRVVGVVLSGSLTDGSAGLAAIKQGGGFALVEDPAMALHPGMPRSAIRSVDVDLVADSETLGGEAVRIVQRWQVEDAAADAASGEP